MFDFQFFETLVDYFAMIGEVKIELLSKVSFNRILVAYLLQKAHSTYPTVFCAENFQTFLSDIITVIIFKIFPHKKLWEIWKVFAKNTRCVTLSYFLDSF